MRYHNYEREKIAGIHCPHMKKEVYHLKRDGNPLRRHAMSFSCLGKLNATNMEIMARWKAYLEILFRQTANDGDIPANPLIIGLAESGIIPSALCHRILREKGIQAEWICSTRRPASGLRFTESHSHGPDHILPIPRYQPKELWFIEDEITTGQTLLRLCLSMCECMSPDRVRFFALADTRNRAARERFGNILRDYGIRFSTHILMRFEPVMEFQPENESTLPSEDMRVEKTVIPMPDAGTGWYYPNLRPGLKSQSSFTIPFATNVKGTLLAVGESIDLGIGLAQANPGLRLHHVTMSPWEIDGRHVFSRLDIGKSYYLYNIDNLQPPLHILTDPVDDAIGVEMISRLAEKGLTAKQIGSDLFI